MLFVRTPFFFFFILCYSPFPPHTTMDFTNDPFVFHAILMILTPVTLLVFVLMWKNAREVQRLKANAVLQPPCLTSSSQPPCGQPTYIDRFTSNSPYSSADATTGKSLLLTADDNSTYSYFGDFLVPRMWLLTPEDSAAVDSALRCG